MARRTLEIKWANGKVERLEVKCGSDWNARRLTKRVGMALAAGEATAVLSSCGPRTAVKRGGRYYMRVPPCGASCKAR